MPKIAYEFIFSLSIDSGASKRNTLSVVLVIALTSRGKRVLRNPLLSFLRLGNLTPSLKSESTAVKLGNPRSSSMIAASRVGITICNAERTVFVENATCFASEKASSLGM